LVVGQLLKNGALVNVLQALLVVHWKVLQQVLRLGLSEVSLVAPSAALVDSLVEEFSSFKIITIRR
jgi:hypothetical protein